MAWHIFEKLLEEVANQSPFVGKIWITSLFMFRLIVVASIGDHVYSDEQSAFRCNTLQPGCENVCFNQFSPISQIRFWAVQILFVGTPSIIFMIYALPKLKKATTIHQNKREIEKEKHISEETENKIPQTENEVASPPTAPSVQDILKSNKNQLPQYDEVVFEDGKMSVLSNNKLRNRVSNHNLYVKLNANGRDDISCRSSNQDPGAIKSAPGSQASSKAVSRKRETKAEISYKTEVTVNIKRTPKLWGAYFVHVIARTGVEAAFLYMQYDLYKFHVGELYVCEGFPCPRVVECFVSRPKEKTLFLRFMYITSLLSLVLNVIEVIYLMVVGIRRCCCRGKNEEESDGSSGYQFTPYIPRNVFRGHNLVREVSSFPQNTYPSLRPYPRTHTNSFGETSEGTIDSDYRFYDI